MGKITPEHVRLVLEALAAEPGDSGKKPGWIASGATAEGVSALTQTADQVLDSKLGHGNDGISR